MHSRSEDPGMANLLTASADAGHGEADDSRSVSGWVVMLNGAMVSWASKHTQNRRSIQYRNAQWNVCIPLTRDVALGL